MVAAPAVFVAASIGSLLAHGDRPNEQGLQRTFAQFDQAYIPALALMKQENQPSSPAAIGRLTHEWKQLRPALATAIADDSRSMHDLESVDEAIAKSAQQVQDGQLAKAYMYFGDFPKVASSDGKSKTHASRAKQ